MDFNTTINLIIKDLEEAREIIDDLKRYPGVPSLQVELAKSKCKSAGEVIATLKTLKDSSPDAQTQPLQQVPQQKQHTPEINKTLEPTPVVIELESKKTLIKDEELHIVADRFSDHSNRLNEQFGNLKSDEDISEILKAKPLTSLSEAIGVNDKFHFIREIFNGNPKAYAQAISRLEVAESMSDARAVIMSYTGDGNENEAVKLLLDLVKRKLSSNE
jgi:hypothetical protein